MKHALTAATLLLVAGSALGCGGSEATSETSQQDYCDAYNAYFDAMVDLGLDASDAEVVEQIKSWGEDLEELGPPEGMPEDARAGRATMLELIDQIDEDSTEEEVTAMTEDLTTEEQAQVSAYEEYNESACEVVTESPSESPTGSSSE